MTCPFCFTLILDMGQWVSLYKCGTLWDHFNDRPLYPYTTCQSG